ncbi:MAG: CHAT domain-containing protein [Acidisphaera sp.]|nr:CHAT domain-containing protein [Acidisphaera sp.]
MALASCARPPPEAYLGGHPGGSATTALAVGRNAAGEACTQQAAAAGQVDIFCGTWEQPSAHVARGGAAGADALIGLAAASPWRAALDTRYVCGTPTSTTILGGLPAAALQCTRKAGGWPQLALVASIDGTAYQADGVEPTLPVMERSIGVLSGRLQADAAPPPSQADALFAARLAAQAFSSGDIGQYERLMLAGTRANLAESYAAAEQAFRAALALQQKALGHDNPNTANALMSLALQISDQGRFAEADALFAQAQRLAAHAADATAPARLLHYQALDALNQGHDEAALGLLQRAEAGYAALLPKEALASRPAAGRMVLASSGGGSMSDLPSEDELVSDPAQQSALVGVIETRRYQAIVLRALNRRQESEAEIAAAESLAAAHGLRQPILTARLSRTAATAASLAGHYAAASAGLAQSTVDFTTAQPGTRPLAQTELLHAAELARQNDTADALGLCRQGVALLRTLRAGTRPSLLEPCLAIYAAAADRQPADRQQLLAEMFEASQLAQGGVTSQQIALATARLGENSRDPRVGDAIRRQQDAQARLDVLYRQREAMVQEQGAPAAPANAATLDHAIAEAQGAYADADAALQAASPNYGQLVQQVVSAKDVLAALGPDEAFAAITLTDDGGWTFVLRGGQIAVARVPANSAQMTALVQRVRAGIEPTTAALPRFDVADAQQIYRDTLGPLEAQLQGVGSLVVAPAGPLLSLPFAVLLTGPADAEHLADAPWLLKRFAIAHVPAAANFVSLRKVAGGSRAGLPWFGFGDFRPVTLAQAERSFPGSSCADSAKLFAGLPPLPYARRELEAARALLGGRPQDEMLGPAFTAAAVRNADLRNYRVLHFAAHALLPAELKCESEPAIVTSDPPRAPDASGALLTASEVTGLQLDADVVVLSACNSGGPGGETAGESLSGLARSFFYAGARSLMVTHWSVNDQAAAFLVADTMRRLKAGQDGGIAGALRGAQLGMLAEAGKGMPAAIAHPFFWAPFALIGEGRGRTVTAGLDHDRHS